MEGGKDSGSILYKFHFTKRRNNETLFYKDIKITVGILVRSYDLHIKELNMNRPVSSPMPLAI